MDRNIVIVLALLITSFSIHASDACKIDIEMGLVINDKHVRIIDNYRTQVQFNKPSQVIIQGSVLTLDLQQQAIVQSYIEQVSQHVPEYIDLIVDGAMLASSWINQLASSLHGENSENHLRVRSQIEHVVMKIMGKYNHRDQNFFLGPQSLNSLEQTINDEFSAQMKSLTANNLNLFLSAMNDDTDNFKEKMQKFGDRLNRLSADVIAELELKSGNLDVKSQEFCQRLVAIDLIETKMQHHIPQLENFNIFNLR
ncbi:DUF2884 family protein [Algibacillus agarilyticus]|uniref:DUF2884 family protein n=1 Tax=Algibacillus agarilyticus TaxID=2234133 RepID=UPI000DCF6832|nr:DUF2884 family protein [Algibacillus agarilyticus]